MKDIFITGVNTPRDDYIEITYGDCEMPIYLICGCEHRCYLQVGEAKIATVIPKVRRNGEVYGANLKLQVWYRQSLWWRTDRHYLLAIECWSARLTDEYCYKSDYHRAFARKFWEAFYTAQQDVIKQIANDAPALMEGIDHQQTA